MSDGVAGANTLQYCRLFAVTFRRDQRQDRPADHLFRAVAEDALRSAIPACNNTSKVFAYDRVVRRFNDRCQQAGRLVGPLELRDIPREGARVDKAAVVPKNAGG